MVFAISDDVFGAVLGPYGRAMSFGAKFAGYAAFFLGPFFTFLVAAYVGLLKEPIRTVPALAVLCVALYLIRKPIRKQFGSGSQPREQAKSETGSSNGTVRRDEP